ncbi:MAG TPA: CHAT domain-containing protein [Kofleriaceae bacterium]|nr:CHAT domain-containing protein [Kofleriaceae bacterium]
MKAAWKPEEIEALAAGELAEEHHERVLAALAADPAAAAELEHCLQLRAVAFEVAAAQPADLGAVRERKRNEHARSRRWIGVAVPVVAAAAALVIYLVVRRPDHRTQVASVEDRFAAALRPHRELEPRLSWPGADRHRAYDPPRAGSGEAEHVSFDLLAELEHTGDRRAVAAAQILVGNAPAAAAELAKDTSADAANDRAALALVQGDAERALREAAAALALAPDHPQARWNRALALHALGLDRAAAAMFDAIAARGEPGWSSEAHDLAAALHAARARHDAAWKTVHAAGSAMVAGGPPPMDQVAAFPGILRLYFYDAVRSAGSADRVRALQPLATALDAAFGGDHLAKYAARIAAEPFTLRAPLAARYAALVRGELDANAGAALVRDLRAAHATDILIGALLQVSPTDHVAPADLAELVKLAEATGDPWFALFAAQQKGAVALERGDLAGAAQVLQVAAEQCERAPMPYRCTAIYQRLADADELMSLPAAAIEALAKVRATAAGVVPYENDTLVSEAQAQTLRDDVGGNGAEVATAYLEEIQHSDQLCEGKRLASDAVVFAWINQHQLAKARAVHAATAACTDPQLRYRGLVEVELVDHADHAAVAALRAQLVAVRPGATEGERAFLDHLEGRLVLPESPDEGRALLRRAIATKARDPSAVKARAYSFSILVEDAGRRSAWDEALALLAEERGATLPVTCAIGAAEETAAVFAARGPDGSSVGAFLPRAIGEPLGHARVPDAVVTAVGACATVDVLARQPYYGAPVLLPGKLAWRYRTGSAAAMPRANAPLVVIANVPTPPALHLAPLAPVTPPAGAIVLEGPAATPARAMAAMSDAGFIEIHAHGLTDMGDDAAVLVLAPAATGGYALASSAIAATPLRAHPVVAIAACGAAATGHVFQTTWGLADAFRAAGASAVIASPDPIADAAAPKFFAAVRARIAAGTDPSVAVRDEKAEWAARGDHAWIDRIVVFQ